MFIQLFYTLYLIYMKKKVKKMFMERICLYNCFIRCILIERKRMQSKCLWKLDIYTNALHIVFELLLEILFSYELYSN